MATYQVSNFTMLYYNMFLGVFCLFVFFFSVFFFFFSFQNRTMYNINILVELAVLKFNTPVNNFSVMSGWSHHFLDINQHCMAYMFQGHNKSPFVGIKPKTSRFRAGCSTPMPQSSLQVISYRASRKNLTATVCKNFMNMEGPQFSSFFHSYFSASFFFLFKN